MYFKIFWTFQLVKKNTMFNVYLDMLICGSPIIEIMKFNYELIINYHNESTWRRQWLTKPIFGHVATCKHTSYSLVQWITRRSNLRVCIWYLKTISRLDLILKIIGCKWVYKKIIEILRVEDTRFEIRLIVKSFVKKEDIIFNEQIPSCEAYIFPLMHYLLWLLCSQNMFNLHIYSDLEGFNA